MAINSVQDLIDELNQVEDKSKPIFAYVTLLTERGGQESFDCANITDIDFNLTDRVDINIDIKG